MQADLENSSEVAGLIETASGKAGGALSGLINNASVFDYDTPEKMDAKIMETAHRVNYLAPVSLCAAFYQQAEAGANNVIINLLDQKLWNLNPDFFSYTVSKAALAAAAQMMAMQYQSRARVNAVAPGLLFPSFDQPKKSLGKLRQETCLKNQLTLSKSAKR